MMTDGYSTDLRFIVGPFNGTINKKSPAYDFVVNKPHNYHAEDIEKTILFYINDGGVLRFNEYGYLALPMFTKGGIASDVSDRYKDINEGNKELVRNNEIFILLYNFEW